MSNELDRLAEGIRQNRAALRDLVTPGAASVSAIAGTSVADFQPGDRVFDLVTGQAAEVVHGSRENVIVPAT
jgi:hydrogenase maturation factor HypE